MRLWFVPSWLRVRPLHRHPLDEDVCGSCVRCWCSACGWFSRRTICRIDRIGFSRFASVRRWCAAGGRISRRTICRICYKNAVWVSGARRWCAAGGRVHGNTIAASFTRVWLKFQVHCIDVTVKLGFLGERFAAREWRWCAAGSRVAQCWCSIGAWLACEMCIHVANAIVANEIAANAIAAWCWMHLQLSTARGCRRLPSIPRTQQLASFALPTSEWVVERTHNSVLVLSLQTSPLCCPTCIAACSREAASCGGQNCRRIRARRAW